MRLRLYSHGPPHRLRQPWPRSALLLDSGLDQDLFLLANELPRHELAIFAPCCGAVAVGLASRQRRIGRSEIDGKQSGKLHPEQSDGHWRNDNKSASGALSSDRDKAADKSTGASNQKKSTQSDKAADENADSSAVRNGETTSSAIDSKSTDPTESVMSRGRDASTERSAVDRSARAGGALSAALLSGALNLTPADDGLDESQKSLTGRPVSLGGALGRGLNQQQRLEIASLYWKLSLAIADYHWSVDEALQLNAMPAEHGAIDSPLFATARASAEAATLEAKATAVTTQQELADALGQPTQPLPLTVEQPLVGPYRTHFDTIFATRPAPGRTRAIDRGLPARREAIDLRTAAVQAAASAVQLCEKEFIKNNASVETLLYAHHELSQQRRAFLRTVRDYNAEIIEYASYVAGPNTTSATIMSMLTRPRSNGVSGVNGSTTFATRQEPTVADPMLDPDVLPAGAEVDASDAGQQRTDDFTGSTDESRTKSKASGANQK